jgi:hypothetical protein
MAKTISLISYNLKYYHQPWFCLKTGLGNLLPKTEALRLLQKHNLREEAKIQTNGPAQWEICIWRC